MSRDASLEVDFGDGTYRFRLGYRELMELQEKCDAGPTWILQRLAAPNAENRGWRVEDIANIIRLGLIGGGMAPTDALRFVRTYVEGRPLIESLLPAQTILSVALVGAPDEEKKSAEKATPSTTSPGASGGSEPSSAPAPQSVSRRAKSKTAQSGS